MEQYYEVEHTWRLHGKDCTESQGFENYEDALQDYNERCERNDIKEVKLINVVETALNEPYKKGKVTEMTYELVVLSDYMQFDTQEKAMEHYRKVIEKNPKLQKRINLPVKVYRAVIKKY